MPTTTVERITCANCRHRAQAFGVAGTPYYSCAKGQLVECSTNGYTEWASLDERVPVVTHGTGTANDIQVGGAHYVKQKIQPWDFISQNEIPFLEGTAIKYLARHREKGGKQDLEKAIHFIQKAIEVYYP